MDIVIFEKVSKTYPMGEQDVLALDDVSFTIQEGTFAALVGPSGSGKTTALNLIGCLDNPTSGRVTVVGKDVKGWNRRQSAAFRGEKLGFVFQDFNLLPVLTVFENVEYPLLMVRKTPKNQRKAAVYEVLEEVGMSGKASKFPAQISGGEKQRVAVARAMVGKPALVVADEPTANLDGETAHKVIALMKRMRDDFGTTFVFSTHDSRILDQAEVLFRLEDGKMISNSTLQKEVPRD